MPRDTLVDSKKYETMNYNKFSFVASNRGINEHHVEEIMPVFTHVLMLQEGRVLCSGEKGKVMDSKNLSNLFSAKATLRQQGGRYSLAVSAHSQRIA